MRGASLLSVPSTTPETFGLVGVEAACVGLPAVGFASGGVTEWLIDNYSGVCADGERPNALNLASAIVRALEDPFRYNELRRGAWQVSRRFTVEHHVHELTLILSGAAQRESSRSAAPRSQAKTHRI
jgi:glycosyltransferase involved in cell wall biosynthesis